MTTAGQAGTSFQHGDRVYVTDPGLAELRAMMRQFGHDPAPNHHGTVDYVEGDLVVITFDDGNAAPYPADEVRPEDDEQPGAFR